jgi:hypothetical protein
MSAATKGKFQILQKTRFDALVKGDVVELPESDLCFQNNEDIIQFKYLRPDEDKKYEIKPGIYTLADSPSGINLLKTELQNEPLLETIDNTSKIIAEARKFFSKLHVYEKRGRAKKRGVLLYSKPGMGKTQAIKKFCRDFCSEDPGTVVFIWPTSAVEADSVSRFLTTQSEYVPECTRLILIVEDIGGGERDGDRGRMAVDSGLLDLLDGVGVTFKLPTFIVSTTNHPENLMESLANRPGRFDLKMELKPPRYEERVALLAFIAQKELNEEERDCLKLKGSEEFSIAHLTEVVIRSELDDKSYADVVKELIEEAKQFKKGFEEDRKLGIGL